MQDVQHETDVRCVPIERVGVRGLSYPIRVRDKANEHQHTVATISMSVGLSESFKGTHMSRFIGVLNAHRHELAADKLPDLLQDLQMALASSAAFFEADFPYFIERKAPVTRNAGLMEYHCSFNASLVVENDGHNHFTMKIGVTVPVTSLCPCSKAISEHGAHNQRGYVTIEVQPRAAVLELETVWFEDLIEVAEASSSCPVYSLLKRDDEKYVTEQAYEHPVFVEDIVRNVAVKLRQDERILRYRIQADNHESIHNHVAFAVVESR